MACDVIQSEGIIGGPYVPLDKQKKPVDLIFCNPDLIWRADFERPRIGQGGFKVAFQAVFKVIIFHLQIPSLCLITEKALTGVEYPHVQYGKPSAETYSYASEVLQGWIRTLYGPGNHVPHLYVLYRLLISRGNPDDVCRYMVGGEVASLDAETLYCSQIAVRKITLNLVRHNMFLLKPTEFLIPEPFFRRYSRCKCC